MPFLTDAFITSMLGGTTVGAAKYAALTGGDSATKAAWITMADDEVVSAAIKGGYSSVSATTPTPSSGAAYEKLRLLAFQEWHIIAHRYGREIDTGKQIGEASAQLYVTSPTVPRTDLPGLERDALGGSSGGDIVNGDDATTATPTAPVFSLENLSDGGYG